MTISEWVSNDLAAKPLDRALLAAFAELVHADGAGLVGDLGCGPGRVAAHLHCLGLSVFGVDLSPAMVAVARRAYPDLRFDEGSIAAVESPDGALAGVVAWYSIIHTPPEELRRRNARRIVSAEPKPHWAAARVTAIGSVSSSRRSASTRTCSTYSAGGLPSRR